MLFQNLPVDVAIEIFDKYVIENDSGPLTLCLVSRTWRNTVLGAPRLWRQIEISDEEECDEKVHLFHSLSLPMTLDVTINMPCPDLNVYKIYMHRWRRIFITCKPERLHIIQLETWNGRMMRFLKSLVTLLDSSSEPLALEEILTDVPPRAGHTDDFNHMAKILSSRAPKLARVFSILSSFILWRTLTEITISFLPRGTDIFRHVSSYELQHPRANPPATKAIQLPSLARLNVQMTRHTSTLVKLFCMPRLEHLSVRCTSQELRQVLENLDDLSKLKVLELSLEHPSSHPYDAQITLPIRTLVGKLGQHNLAFKYRETFAAETITRILRYSPQLTSLVLWIENLNVYVDALEILSGIQTLKSLEVNESFLSKGLVIPEQNIVFTGLQKLHFKSRYPKIQSILKMLTMPLLLDLSIEWPFSSHDNLSPNANDHPFLYLQRLTTLESLVIKAPSTITKEFHQPLTLPNLHQLTCTIPICYSLLKVLISGPSLRLKIIMSSIEDCYVTWSPTWSDRSPRLDLITELDVSDGDNTFTMEWERYLPHFDSLKTIKLPAPTFSSPTNEILQILIRNYPRKHHCPQLREIHTHSYPNWDLLFQFLHIRNCNTHPSDTSPLENLYLPGYPHRSILEPLKLAFAGICSPLFSYARNAKCALCKASGWDCNSNPNVLSDRSCWRHQGGEVRINQFT